jgi:hypothetical protein
MACQKQGLDRVDYRFSRRDVREHTGWGNTQLKVHLRRLEELEYLLVHRDRASRRLFYELLYHKPAQDGGKVLAGLIDVEQLRRAEWSGEDEPKSGDGRSKAGPMPGHCRHDDNAANPVIFQANSTNGQQAVETVNAAACVS